MQIKLVDFGEKKIYVIKALRNSCPTGMTTLNGATGSRLSIKDANRLAEMAPVTLNDHMPEGTNYEELASTLTAAGATVEIMVEKDPELQTMQSIAKQMQFLDLEARKRVAGWIFDRFG